MQSQQITSTFTSMSRKVVTVLVACLAAIALVLAGPARADTKQGSGGTTGCQIENDGKIETVPVGTKVGLFTCGEDGEWHFGWLINSIGAQKLKANPGTAGTTRGVAPRHNGVLRIARASR